MKKAALYLRVSTDEQANGYSINYQEERLTHYCNLYGIKIAAIYKEDYSAKTFNRPEYSKFLKQAEKGIFDLLLFIKWDRFSRNTTDSYAMIQTLHKLGIQPQAIEQPIDIEIPEQRLMLAFYLSAPEVENARRGLNTLSGMRRAKKEGRWVSTAPKGYSFQKINGKPQLVPNDSAPLIKFIFDELGKGIYSVEQVYFKSRKLGYKSCRSNFHKLVKNIVYAGYIKIDKYKDEPEQLIKGIHEPIITLEQFKHVQDYLNGRKKQKKTSSLKDDLPLRGHVICPECGSPFTGSGSKNRWKQIYYYYHCQRPCKRYRADMMNEKLRILLSTFTLPPEWQRLAFEVWKDKLKSDDGDKEREIKSLEQQLDSLQGRLTEAQDMLFDRKIDTDTYSTAKERYERQITELRTNINSLKNSSAETEEKLRYVISLIANLPKYYTTSTVEVKQKILCSIFPEKLVFDGENYRTPRVNKMLDIFALKYSNLQSHKTENALHLESVSTLVAPDRQLSNTNISECLVDLDILFGLKEVVPL